MTVLESALIVPVPEVEPLVGLHRAALDPAAKLGVPAHVTIVYPFLPPEQITDHVRRTVRAVVERHRRSTSTSRERCGSTTWSSGCPPSRPKGFVI